MQNKTEQYDDMLVFISSESMVSLDGLIREYDNPEKISPEKLSNHKIINAFQLLSFLLAHRYVKFVSMRDANKSLRNVIKPTALGQKMANRIRSRDNGISFWHSCVQKKYTRGGEIIICPSVIGLYMAICQYIENPGIRSIENIRVGGPYRHAYRKFEKSLVAKIRVGGETITDLQIADFRNVLSRLHKRAIDARFSGIRWPIGTKLRFDRNFELKRVL
jgi:hypothetical protein